MLDFYGAHLPSRTSLSPGNTSTKYYGICEDYAICKKYIPISPQKFLYLMPDNQQPGHEFQLCSIDHGTSQTCCKIQEKAIFEVCSLNLPAWQSLRYVNKLKVSDKPY